MKHHHVTTRIVGSRPRLFSCIAAGAVSYLILPDTWRVVARGLLAWNIGVVLYLALIALMIYKSNPHSIIRRAAQQDEGRFVILLLSTVAAIASIAAIIAQLGSVKEMEFAAKAPHVALSLSTIVTSWVFIHVMYALHYAHEYFFESRSHPDVPGQSRGGLAFCGGDMPDYGDFIYFAVAIGCAAATSDTNVTSRAMRRIVTAHSMLSFFYNTTILALTINIVAGLL